MATGSAIIPKKRSRYEPFEKAAVSLARYSGREKSEGQCYRKKRKNI
jgi:hypothetical protein